MEAIKDKFAVISEIYSHFTEKNKENLFMTAVNLLEVQKEDAKMLNAGEDKFKGDSK